MIKTLLLLLCLLAAPAIAQNVEVDVAIKFLTGDTNGDGTADLVVVTNTQQGPALVRVWPANGYFATQPACAVTLDLYFSGVYLLADTNADGRADLINVFSYGDQVAYFTWLAQPSGCFSHDPTYGYYGLGALFP